MRFILFWCSFLFLPAVAMAQDNKSPSPPKPQFQGDFFGEMPRAFCVIQSIDIRDRILTVKLDGKGEIRRVPIRDDTELHFRDSWGELTDYCPGQHVMLFMYADEDRKWTYPRAVQDDIHMRARHNHFARVVKFDTADLTYNTEREEKNGQGQVTQIVRDTIRYAPEVKVWKSDKPEGIASLKIGDEVIQQLAEKDGKLTAIEVFDRKGDDAIRAIQDARHKQDQDRFGLPAYVTDVDPISGSLVVSVAWSGADRAKKDLKDGDVVTLIPVDGSKAFAGAACSMQSVDMRQRIQMLVGRLACLHR
jgi:hypothetical protein